MKGDWPEPPEADELHNPRASLRSVFTTIADSAALTAGFSKSTTSNPGGEIRVQPLRQGPPRFDPDAPHGKAQPLEERYQNMRIAGDLCFLDDLLVASTTHTLECSKDTAIPASYCIGWLPELRCLGAEPHSDPFHHPIRRQPPSPHAPTEGPLRHLALAPGRVPFSLVHDSSLCTAF